MLISQKLLVVFASFLFTYVSLCRTTAILPIDFLEIFRIHRASEDVTAKEYIINFLIHFFLSLIFVVIFSGVVLSDSGKSFIDIENWKLAIFTGTMTAIIFKGKGLKEVLG